MSFRQESKEAARKAGGSFKTRAAREQMMGQLADYLERENIQIWQIAQLKLKHIKGWITASRQEGISDRSCQNRLTAVRGCLRAAGMTRKGAEIRTRDFGVDGASREGTRAAISATAYAERIAKITNPAVAATLELQRHLGLRQMEAIRGGERETLARWLRELSHGDRVRVVLGTKGGRPRETRVLDREAALGAVGQALERVGKNGRLIQAAGLKQAVDQFNNAVRAAGFIGDCSPHSLRYAFAQASIRRYEAEGFSHGEALALTSLDLGHGDGRGRWIEHVYGRGQDGGSKEADSNETSERRIGEFAAAKGGAILT